MLQLNRKEIFAQLIKSTTDPARIIDFFKKLIKDSESLFNKPESFYYKKSEIPKRRFRKKVNNENLLIGEEFYSNGALKYTGTYNINKERHGKGTAYSPCEEGVKYPEDGYSTYFYIGTKIICDCNYQNGKLHGKLSFTNRNYDNTQFYMDKADAKSTYFKKDKYKLVKLNDVITQPFDSLDCINFQDFDQGDMSGTHSIYERKQNGDLKLISKSIRRNGSLIGTKRIYYDTMKIESIIAMKNESMGPDFIVPTDFEGIVNHIKRDSKSEIQKFKYQKNGQTARIYVNGELEINYRKNGIFDSKLVTIPKGFDPHLQAGSKLWAYFGGEYNGGKIVKSFLSSLSDTFGDSRGKIAKFTREGTLTNYGILQPTKSKNPRSNRAKGLMFYRYRGFKRLFHDYDPASNQKDFTRINHVNDYTIKEYGKNGKLISVFDSAKNVQITYNNNGTFIKQIFKKEYQIIWKNEPKCYVETQGSINKESEFHGNNILVADITGHKIVYEIKDYLNGEETKIDETQNEADQEEKMIQEQKNQSDNKIDLNPEHQSTNLNASDQNTETKTGCENLNQPELISETKNDAKIETENSKHPAIELETKNYCEIPTQQLINPDGSEQNSETKNDAKTESENSKQPIIESKTKNDYEIPTKQPSSPCISDQNTATKNDCENLELVSETKNDCENSKQLTITRQIKFDARIKSEKPVKLTADVEADILPKSNTKLLEASINKNDINQEKLTEIIAKKNIDNEVKISSKYNALMLRYEVKKRLIHTAPNLNTKTLRPTRKNIPTPKSPKKTDNPKPINPDSNPTKKIDTKPIISKQHTSPQRLVKPQNTQKDASKIQTNLIVKKDELMYEKKYWKKLQPN